MLKTLVTLASLAMTLSSATVLKHPRAPVQTNSDDTFIVGILGPDGVIVPFAQYANQKWTNPWHSPQPEEPPDEPDTIADLEKPWFESSTKPSSDWYLWSTSGEPTTLKTSKMVQVDSHCQHVWGLVTDYPKQPAKDGCARNVGAVLSEKKR